MDDWQGVGTTNHSLDSGFSTLYPELCTEDFTSELPNVQLIPVVAS